MDCKGILYITAERTVISEVRIHEAIPALVATFYIYNMKYNVVKMYSLF